MQGFVPRGRHVYAAWHKSTIKNARRRRVWWLPTVWEWACLEKTVHSPLSFKDVHAGMKVQMNAQLWTCRTSVFVSNVCVSESVCAPPSRQERQLLTIIAPIPTHPKPSQCRRFGRQDNRVYVRFGSALVAEFFFLFLLELSFHPHPSSHTSIHTDFTFTCLVKRDKQVRKVKN